MKLKTIIFACFVLTSLQIHSQYAVKNYTNANIEQISVVKQIADWIQFNNAESMFTLISETTSVDLEYLKIESNFISKEYPNDKIISHQDISISDDRTIIWYERNIYKKSKTKLKARYQIYFTIEFNDSSHQIIDLTFGKKKKINTSNYTKN